MSRENLSCEIRLNEGDIKMSLIWSGSNRTLTTAVQCSGLIALVEGKCAVSCLRSVSYTMIGARESIWSRLRAVIMILSELSDISGQKEFTGVKPMRG